METINIAARKQTCFDRLGCYYLLYRAYEQLHAHDKDERRNAQAGDILKPPVAERVVKVRLFAG